MGTIATAAVELQSQISEWYRELHRIPEIGHDLPRTEALLLRELSKMGLDRVESGKGSFAGKAGHGVLAVLKGQKSGKTLALRADMDALPVREETGLAFASDGDVMHACGHDAHMAILLGAAKILSKRREELSGEIRFIFQPAEEILQGALAMIEEGILDGVDAIVGLHISTLLCPLGKPGVIGWRKGPTMASADEVDVEFRGKGTHGSTPHLGTDPVVMGCEAVCRLQRIVSREVDPLDTVVISVGSFQAGSMCNIIPDTCTIKSTVRTLNSQTRDFVLRRIAETVEDTAKSMRGTATLSFPIRSVPLINDPALVEKICRIVGDELGEDSLEEMARPLMGSEDFAYFLEKVPGVFLFLSAGFGDERDIPHHNARFRPDESVFWKGTAAFCAFALGWQKD